MTMKRSALFYLHQRQGASFIEYRGWELPAFFSSPEREAAHVRESVGLADQSDLLKFDLQKEPESNGWRLGANHYLMIGEPPLAPPSGAIDISSVYACFLLAGPRSRDVLSKLTSLNVSNVALLNLSCAQTSLAHVHTILMRADIASILAFYLLVSREYAESVWESIVRAGREFHLRLFGLMALRSLHN
jgi:glycine cleavage system aminomethyltransferase T